MRPPQSSGIEPAAFFLFEAKFSAFCAFFGAHRPPPRLDPAFWASNNVLPASIPMNRRLRPSRSGAF